MDYWYTSFSLCSHPLSLWILLHVCLLIWLSSLCQSVPLSSNISLPLILSRWPFLLSLPSSPQSIVSLLPVSLLPSPPHTLYMYHFSFSSLNPTCPACLRSECPTLNSSLLAPLLLFLLFIYTERDGGREGLSGWIDGWQEAMGEGVWAFDWRSCHSG